MVENYHVIEEKEILHELTAGLLSELRRLMRQQHVKRSEQPTHALTKFYNELMDFHESILGNHFNTIKDMDEANEIYRHEKSELANLKEQYHG